jgi:hypothetical protein
MPNISFGSRSVLPVVPPQVRISLSSGSMTLTPAHLSLGPIPEITKSPAVLEEQEAARAGSVERVLGHAFRGVEAVYDRRHLPPLPLAKFQAGGIVIKVSHN